MRVFLRIDFARNSARILCPSGIVPLAGNGGAGERCVARGTEQALLCALARCIGRMQCKVVAWFLSTESPIVCASMNYSNDCMSEYERGGILSLPVGDLGKNGKRR